jgi:hypothetical protein
LTKKTFFAQQWLQKEVDPYEVPARQHPETKPEVRDPLKERFRTFNVPVPALNTKLGPDDRFSPLHCFVPGWKGDSLPSKAVIKFDRLITLIHQDIKNELLKTKDFPRSIKFGLHNEFLSYAESMGLHFEGLDDLGRFWSMIDAEKLKQHPQIAEFVDIFTNRVAAITFYKLRFISSLINACSLELNDRALLYPTSFLSQIFRKGSQLELNSRSLESNLYSWYQPHEKMKDVMKELLLLAPHLSITEITKNVSLRTQVRQEQPNVYSHALSNVSFGLFLNSLQINYPIWLETIENRSVLSGGLEQEQIISCKYRGDYLESLSLSHWLAQENNKDFRWYEFLCPDFKGKEFVSGLFIKICNELQFLTFLAHKAVNQGERPAEYISRIMGGHFRNRKNAGPRGGLLLEDTSTYDRVVLNLCHFPKNNPQHFLMAQIMDQVKFLKPNGYLFVLSSKKLFVPSLRDRLEPVLRELKTEAIFDLENVKGKGELGSYIYIFRKVARKDDEKQLCSYFRLTAELENFHQFACITEHLRTFYLSNLNESPAMSQLDFPGSFRIEFFQEAVSGGMLIHSASDDSSRITHPSYFKSLLDSCMPLNTFFEIRSISSGEKLQNESALNLGLKRDPSYFLVVDFRGPEVNLEMHPADTFRSIYSDYGESLCSYFQLTPKLSGLNPNLLRNFFLSPVGKQIAALTFSGGHNLVKGALSKLLVPKFFAKNELMPEQIREAFKVLEMSEQDLLAASPQVVRSSLMHVTQISRDLFPRYACEILSRFSSMERVLQGLAAKFNDSRYGQKISFNNPMIQQQLVQLPTAALFPDNQDIYVEFVAGSGPSVIHAPVTETRLQVSHEGELKLYALDLLSHNQTIVRIHSEELMVLFIQFILAQAPNVPASKLLSAVHVPSLANLKTVVEETSSFKLVYQEMLQLIQSTISEAFRLQVSHRRGQ